MYSEHPGGEGSLLYNFVSEGGECKCGRKGIYFANRMDNMPRDMKKRREGENWQLSQTKVHRFSSLARIPVWGTKRNPTAIAEKCSHGEGARGR